MSIDELTNEALQLSAAQRAVLAETIWESLEDPYFLTADITDSEALKAARERDKQIEKGQAVPIPHKDLMAELRRED